MSCKDQCKRYKAQKPVGIGRYISGQKRCIICEIYLNWDGLWCPCCKYRLRTKPRNIKYKDKFKQHQAEGRQVEFKSIITELKERDMELEKPINLPLQELG